MRNSIGLLILLLIFSGVILGACNPNPGSQSAPAPEILAGAETLKLSITQEGMYRLPLADLGWETSTPENITLTHKDEVIPIWLESEGGETALVFYGEASSSPYTPINVYSLEKDGSSPQPMNSQALPEISGAPVDHFISTLHLEENQLYVPKVDRDSPWHWLKIVAPQSQTLEFDLPKATDGRGYLRVALWGSTMAPMTPDHHVRVSINGQIINEVSWDGQTWQILEGEIPAGVLTEKSNQLEIQATGETDARIDIVNLDWIEVDYAKAADQLEGQEFFRTAADPVQLAGFEGPLDIFDITSPSEISRLESPSEDETSLVFQGNPAKNYLSVTPEGYLYPQQIQPVENVPDLRTLSGASYLAIGHPDLLKPLEPLLQAREDQGLSTLTISAQTIYDQFNGGMPEPEALQKFLAYAVQNWERPPEYVLLLGDSSYDYYGYQSQPEAHFLPTFLVPTVFGGETGSDVLIGQINDDPWPDLAVGRVPARTPQQVETFVRKTLAFETQDAQDEWATSVLAVADGQEPSFRTDAETFINQFPESYQTQLIAPEAGAQGTHELIATKLEDGTLLAAYFGHGSINMWGKDSLFTTENSADLGNADRLPVILNFTCLTGLFTHPTEESLAESLLFNPTGGAAAILAPTSPTLPTDQSFLSDAFIEGISQFPSPRLGQVTLYAWRQVPIDSPGALDVMQTFLLFGDPALQLPSP